MMRNKFAETGPIKAGDLLLSEEPFAFVLTSKEKGQRCDFCLARGKVLKCSVCQFVHYCGRACQREAWNEHKWECKNIKRISPKVLPDAARLLAKIVCRLSKGDGNSCRSFYTPNSFRMWKDLMSHYSDLKKDEKRMDHFTTLCAVLFDFLKDMSLPNTVELMGIFGRMCINSFTVLDSDMNSIGTAVYLGASVLDHSCRPNSVATFDGRIISVRATEDMPCLDWNQVRISYVDVMKTPFERQAELVRSYYFLCQCERCMDQQQLKLMHGAKCPNRKCNNPIQIPWNENCQLVMKSDSESKSKEETQNVRHTILNNSHEFQNGRREIINNDHEIINARHEILNNGHIVRNDSANSNEDHGVIHCSECESTVTKERAEEFRRVMEFTERHLQDMNNASISFVDVCSRCLEKQDGVLHPLNVLRAQTLDHAVDALIETQLWEQACVHARSLIPCFRNYYGERHPLTGLLYMKYGKILLYTMLPREALEQLKNAQKIIKITHGDKHPLYRDLKPLLEQAIIESQFH